MLRTTRTVTGARPTGDMVLVEMLSAQEAAPTQIIVVGANAGSPPQAYVLALGPSVAEGYGIKVGDRVLLQGTYVPVPVHLDGRAVGVVRPSDVKCVLLEE